MRGDPPEEGPGPLARGQQLGTGRDALSCSRSGRSRSSADVVESGRRPGNLHSVTGSLPEPEQGLLGLKQCGSLAQEARLAPRRGQLSDPTALASGKPA